MSEGSIFSHHFALTFQGYPHYFNHFFAKNRAYFLFNYSFS
jgi:hypothetical protein